MRFQTRLLLTYSLLIILPVVVLGISFYRYSAGVFESNAYANLAVISQKMSQQPDNLIRPMDFVTTYINEGWQTINGALLSYSIGKNFYSVNVFNGNGDFLSSNFNTHTTVQDVPALIRGFAWIPRADEAGGKALILPPYTDPWCRTRDIEVFGLARSVQGPKGRIGYLEVQNPYEDLQRVFSVPDGERINVLAVTTAGDVFYKNGEMDGALIQYYSDLARSMGKSVSLVRNPVTGEEEIVSGSGSEYTGIRVVLAQLLSKSAVAEEYALLHKRIVKAFQEEFSTPSGRLAARTQTAHILALSFDLASGGAPPSNAGHADRPPGREQGTPHHGLSGHAVHLRRLERERRTDAAYGLLLKVDYPSWLYQITKGATTIWEHWDGIKPDGSMWSADMNSFNHYAYGAVGAWLYRVAAGLDTDAPGYKRIRMAPTPGGGLTFARAEHATLYGPTFIEWRIDGVLMRVEILVPHNTTAHVVLPNANPRSVETNWGKLSPCPAGAEAVVGSGRGSFRYPFTG